MQEYTIQRSSRKCYAENRSLEPDERYYSVVIQRGGELVRQDFCKQAWQGPPPGCVGWWMSRMPPKKSGKRTLAPTPILLDSLERLCEQPNQGEIAYLLAILLVRRRILSVAPDDTLVDEESHLELSHSASGRNFLVPVHQPNQERSEQLHQHLVELLYCEA